LIYGFVEKTFYK